jgi:hypothetical protein
MSMSIPLTDLQNSPSAKFEDIGDKYSGTIVSLNERPQTDLMTGAVKTFVDGTPMTQWVITIEQPDGEVYSLYAKGGRPKSCSAGDGESMLSAIGTAVRAAGATSLDVGGQLAVAHTGLGEVRQGMNPMKLYKAQYKAPAPKNSSIPAGDLFSDETF